jgi:hypothetical protein
MLPFLITAGLAAQVPDGWYVWCSFQGTAGQCGVFFSHPRDPNEPFVAVTGLSEDLAYDPAGKQGASCVIRRAADDALLIGERAPVGHSVDLHVLTLRGNDVIRAALFSMGTSAGAGEIPQCALLPDGTVLVAATDLSGGPLAVQQTSQYNKQGIGILNPKSGSITVVPVTTPNPFPGVINGLAASPDGKTAYVGNYVSTTGGDLWSVALPAGGDATQIATFPCGVSHVAVEADGSILVTALNGPPNLFRVHPVTHQVTIVPTTIGPLNAIAIERATGNYAIASANAGVPARSLFYMTPAGQSVLLASPNRATISGVDVNHDPEPFADGSPGGATYTWFTAPNAGGLPETGNASFGIELRASPAFAGPPFVLLGTARATPPWSVLGVTLHVDPYSIWATFMPVPQGSVAKVALPVPNVNGLRGLSLYGQALVLEGATQLAASPGIRITIL